MCIRDSASSSDSTSSRTSRRGSPDNDCRASLEAVVFVDIIIRRIFSIRCTLDSSANRMKNLHPIQLCLQNGGLCWFFGLERGLGEIQRSSDMKNFSVTSLAKAGVPPALPGRPSKFDFCGSPSEHSKL